jgi:hypothetical protein
VEGHTTHEPTPPINWPDGHVGVTQTDAATEECLAVRIHDLVHYQHATTARKLKAAGLRMRV